MQKVHITIVKRGEDTGSIVQYAYSKEQAQKLIDTVMPKLQAGYYYKIV